MARESAISLIIKKYMGKEIKVNINGVVIEGLTLDDAIRVASRMGAKKVRSTTPGMFEVPEAEPSKDVPKKKKKYSMWSDKAIRTMVMNQHLTPSKLMEFPEISTGRNRRTVEGQLGKIRTGKEKVMGPKLWKIYRSIVIDKEQPDDK